MSNKKYYWLKLKDDFFEQDEIKIIEAMDNGKDYIIFYMKLLLKSVKTEGELRFKDTIPYSDKMLATITGVNVDIVRSATNVFIELGLIEKWENQTLYMNEVINMTGSETESAERVRRHRARKKDIENQASEVKSLQCNANVIKGNTEIERELDKEIEIDNKHYGISDAEVAEIVEIWNSIIGVPNIRSMTKTSARFKALNARFKEHGYDVLMEMLLKVRDSDFLRGKNKEGWTPNFDWVVNPTNFIKILEDTYVNKESNHEAGRANNSANKLERIYEEGRRAIEEFDFENFDGTF